MALKNKPKPKPTYSPQTEQEITQAMFDLALAGPRWIGEQMGEDLDEAFEIGKTGVSLKQLVFHPVKTFKKTLRKWTISKWKGMLSAQLVADYVWKPRLGHFGALAGAEKDKILDWVSTPEGYAKDVAFEKLEADRAAGLIGDDVWAGIRRQHGWEEFSRFRRKPGRYLLDKVFGKRGTKEAPLYKLSPQKWLGEPLGRALEKTALGKAVAGVKQGLSRVAKKVVGAAKQTLKAVGKAVGKIAVKGAKWVVTKVAGSATWAAISSAVGGLVGSVAGPLGTVVGFVAGPALTKLTEWALKIACYGCGCVALIFVVIIAFIVVAVSGAFQTAGPGGVVPTVLVEVHKTVSPTHLALGVSGAAAEVSYTIEVTNKTDKEITGGTLVDDFEPSDFLPSVLDHSTWDQVAGTLTWSGLTLSPHGSFAVRPKGFIQDTNTERVIFNNVNFTGMAEGETVSASGSAAVVVGNPPNQPPSGWPAFPACVSQGFNVTSDPAASHYGMNAVDITGTTNQAIYATHDGRASVRYGDLIYGNYVLVTSTNFQTRYAHLLVVAVNDGEMVAPGQILGGMGTTGRSTAVHLHYDVKDIATGKLVTSQYIPDNSFDGCVDRVTIGGNCDCCFNNRGARCGE